MLSFWKMPCNKHKIQYFPIFFHSLNTQIQNPSFETNFSFNNILNTLLESRCHLLIDGILVEPKYIKPSHLDHLDVICTFLLPDRVRPYREGKGSTRSCVEMYYGLVVFHYPGKKVKSDPSNVFFKFSARCTVYAINLTRISFSY